MLLKRYLWYVPIMFSIFLSPSLAPAESNQKDIGDTVNIAVNSLNVRSGPGQQYSIVGSAKKGEKYQILRVQGAWVQISLSKGKGWIASWMVENRSENSKKTNSSSTERSDSSASEGTIKIINPGTNIRSGAGTNYRVIQIANAGDTYPILRRQGDWFKIDLSEGKSGYVAGWLVRAEGYSNVKLANLENLLKGKTIVVDAGHGGEDSGAIGLYLGTLEKEANLRVAELLKDKLEAAGSRVILTRSDDRKISLQGRVNIAKDYQADAFISIHHNTNENTYINGETTYYYSHGADKQLAQLVQKDLVKRTGSADLQSKFGDYFVLRENPRLAILCELGFLTNYQEEIEINSNSFQEQAAQGIFQGIVEYFSEN